MPPKTTKRFDVICAGEARWSVAEERGGADAGSPAMRFRAGGGAVNVAIALGQQGLAVGLATVLEDDTFGRALRERVAAAGVDTGGVALAQPRPGIVFTEATGTARQIVTQVDEDRPVTIPKGWSAQVLVLSGLSPVLAHGAALCKAARAARRIGTLVLIDVNARLHQWAGHDGRKARSLLREADVVRCSTADLAVLGLDLAAVRAALRRNAVLVGDSASGDAWATGPFGEVAQPAKVRGPIRPDASGDAFTAAICAELARAGSAGDDRAALWDRALRRGQDAHVARAR